MDNKCVRWKWLDAQTHCMRCSYITFCISIAPTHVSRINLVRAQSQESQVSRHKSDWKTNVWLQDAMSWRGLKSIDVITLLTEHALLRMSGWLTERLYAACCRRPHPCAVRLFWLNPRGPALGTDSDTDDASVVPSAASRGSSSQTPSVHRSTTKCLGSGIIGDMLVYLSQNDCRKTSAQHHCKYPVVCLCNWADVVYPSNSMKRFDYLARDVPLAISQLFISEIGLVVPPWPCYFELFGLACSVLSHSFVHGGDGWELVLVGQLLLSGAMSDSSLPCDACDSVVPLCDMFVTRHSLW